MQIPADRLTDLARTIFERGGTDTDDATQVAEKLIEANLFGHDSHGVGMVPAYVLGIQEEQLKPKSELTVEHDRGSFLLINGNAGFGQIIARDAMKLTIARAQELGVAVMGLKNSYHIGRVGAWGEMAAAAGFISIHYVNAFSPNSLVAPFGGSDARFTTNPYCTALPASNGADPIVLDMATSRVAMGKVRVAHNKGVDMVPDALIDNQGNPTNDPAVMFSEPKGALRSMGLHKGYGLAVICEALAGAFTGGGVFGLDKVAPGKIINNMLTVLIDPDAFGHRAAFDAEINKFTDWVKASPPAPGMDEVMMPGDPERKSKADRLENGIPIDETTFEELLAAGEAMGLPRDEAMRIVGN
ncbi:MAG: malate/lactate/ureidoglycolate dehydrogenase [Alphaproteobacteria bacterium]|nr:malate/lactate/ureidoglycolate dehydrogenase [Alphaproteobacteria bacterium]